MYFRTRRDTGMRWFDAHRGKWVSAAQQVEWNDQTFSQSKYTIWVSVSQQYSPLPFPFDHRFNLGLQISSYDIILYRKDREKHNVSSPWSSERIEEKHNTRLLDSNTAVMFLSLSLLSFFWPASRHPICVHMASWVNTAHQVTGRKWLDVLLRVSIPYK
jgi:hypothetical protein